MACNVRPAGFACDAGLAEATAPEPFEQVGVAPAPGTSNGSQRTGWLGAEWETSRDFKRIEDAPEQITTDITRLSVINRVSQG